MSTTKPPQSIHLTHTVKLNGDRFCTVELTTWAQVDLIVALATEAFGPRVSSLPPQTKAEAMERGTNLRGYKDSRGNTVLYGPSQDQVGAENPPVGNTVGDQEHHVTSSDDSAPAPQPRVLTSWSSYQMLLGVAYDKLVIDIDTKGVPYEQYRDLLAQWGMDLGGNIYSEVCLFDSNVITFTQYIRRNK